MTKSAILAVKIISDAKGAIDGFGKTGDAAQGLGSKLGGIGPIVAGVGLAVGTAVIAAGKALYDIGAVFDDVTDTIRVGTGAQGEALDSLVESAKKVGTSVPASFEDIGPVIADVNTRLGLTGPILETVASQYLEAGRILGETVDIKGTTAAMSAFGIEGEATSAALDTLFRVSQDTGVGMNALADSVSKQAPALQELGFSYDQSVAFVGTLDKAGLDADKTIAGLSKGLMTLAKSGEAPGESFQRVTGEIGALLDQGDRAGALNLAGTLFGTKGAPQFIASLESGALNMDALTQAAMGTGDTILGVGKETMDAAESFELMKNKAMVVLEPLGSYVFDSVGQAFAWLADLITGIDFTTLGESMPWLDQISASITSIGDLLDTYLPPIIEKYGPIVQEIIGFIGNALAGIMTMIEGVVQFVTALMAGDWDAAWAGAAKIVDGFIQASGGFLQAGWTLLTTIFSNLGKVISALWSALWTQVTSIFSGAVSSVTTAASNLGSKVVAGFRALPGLLVQAGKDAISGLIRGITSMGSEIWSAATGIADNLINSVKSKLGIASPSKVAMSMGKWWGIGLANGLTGTTALVEGAATALVEPLTTKNLLPPTKGLHPNRTAAPGAATMVVNVTVNGAIDSDSTARQIIRVLDEYSRRNGLVQLGGA